MPRSLGLGCLRISADLNLVCPWLVASTCVIQIVMFTPAVSGFLPAISILGFISFLHPIRHSQCLNRHIRYVFHRNLNRNLFCWSFVICYWSFLLLPVNTKSLTVLRKTKQMEIAGRMCPHTVVPLSLCLLPQSDWSLFLSVFLCNQTKWYTISKLGLLHCVTGQMLVNVQMDLFSVEDVWPTQLVLSHMHML